MSVSPEEVKVPDDEEDDDWMRPELEPRVRAKHPRDDDAEEALAEEEVQARAHAELEPEMQLIEVTGPPWYDEYTGEVLNTPRIEKAQDQEHNSFLKFDAYVWVPVEAVPKGAKVIPMRWVLYDRGPPKGEKARIVVQDVNHGAPEDVFAASPTCAGQRLCLCMAAWRQWEAVLGDVSTAFLDAPLEDGQLVFCRPPPGLRREGFLWRLKKAVYGLRTSPRVFQEHFAQTVKKTKRRRMLSDPQVYQHLSGALMTIHADDILLVAPADQVEALKKELGQGLLIKWAEAMRGEWMRYLGKEMRCEGSTVQVRLPEKYYQRILKDYGMSACKPVTTPAVQGEKQNEGEEQELDAPAHAAYRRCIGQLMWLLPERPDLAYVVKELARMVCRPTLWDARRLKRVLRYLQGTMKKVLVLEAPQEPLGDVHVAVVVDATWAGSAGYRSTSGGLVWLNDTWLLQSWSRTQATIALSTCEAELLAMSTAAQEGMLMQSLLTEFGEQVDLTILSDSSAARAVTQKRGVGRMRHLRIRELWLQEAVRERQLMVKAIRTEDNVSDLLTKVLARPRHVMLTEQVGLKDG